MFNDFNKPSQQGPIFIFPKSTGPANAINFFVELKDGEDMSHSQPLDGEVKIFVRQGKNRVPNMAYEEPLYVNNEHNQPTQLVLLVTNGRSETINLDMSAYINAGYEKFVVKAKDKQNRKSEWWCWIIKHSAEPPQTKQKSQTSTTTQNRADPQTTIKATTAAAASNPVAAVSQQHTTKPGVSPQNNPNDNTPGQKQTDKKAKDLEYDINLDVVEKEVKDSHDNITGFEVVAIATVSQGKKVKEEIPVIFFIESQRCDKDPTETDEDGIAKEAFQFKPGGPNGTGKVRIEARVQGTTFKSKPKIANTPKPEKEKREGEHKIERLRISPEGEVGTSTNKKFVRTIEIFDDHGKHTSGTVIITADGCFEARSKDEITSDLDECSCTVKIGPHGVSIVTLTHSEPSIVAVTTYREGHKSITQKLRNL